METLCYQAHSSTSHEASACVCEPQEWWESGKIVCLILFLVYFLLASFGRFPLLFSSILLGNKDIPVFYVVPQPSAGF